MPFQSDAIVEGPALCTGLPSTTLPRFIRDLARQAPERIALVDHGSGRSYTYGAVDRLIGRCAAGLAAQGLRPGDTLLMFAPNVPEWPIVALGALAAGGVVGVTSLLADHAVGDWMRRAFSPRRGARAGRGGPRSGRAGRAPLPRPKH